MAISGHSSILSSSRYRLERGATQLEFPHPDRPTLSRNPIYKKYPDPQKRLVILRLQ